MAALPRHVVVVLLLLISVYKSCFESGIENDKVIVFIAGGISGWVSSAVFYPLDTVEARQQIESNRWRKKSFIKVLRTIYNTEGLYGLYIGWEAGITGVGVNYAIYFTIYTALKSYYYDNGLSPLIDFGCGIIAGLVTSVLVNPFWVLKSQIILQKQNSARSQILLTYIHKFGISALFSGVLVSMTGCVNAALQFMIYSNFVGMMMTDVADRSPVVVFVAGALSNFIATIITYPYLVIRSECQIKSSSTSIKSIMSNIRKKEGFSGFYSGLVANLVRQVPSSACMLVLNELLISKLKANNNTTTMTA